MVVIMMMTIIIIIIVIIIIIIIIIIITIIILNTCHLFQARTFRQTTDNKQNINLHLNKSQQLSSTPFFVFTDVQVK